MFCHLNILWTVGVTSWGTLLIQHAELNMNWFFIPLPNKIDVWVWRVVLNNNSAPFFIRNGQYLIHNQKKIQIFLHAIVVTSCRFFPIWQPATWATGTPQPGVTPSPLGLATTVTGRGCTSSPSNQLTTVSLHPDVPIVILSAVQLLIDLLLELSLLMAELLSKFIKKIIFVMVQMSMIKKNLVLFVCGFIFYLTKDKRHFLEVHEPSNLFWNILDSYLRTFVDFMQNVYAKLHKTFRSFKTSKKFVPDIHAISHKLLGNKKAKEMLTSAACAHFWKQEGFVHLCTYALHIWSLVCTH